MRPGRAGQILASPSGSIRGPDERGRNLMTSGNSFGPIKVGVIADLTGPLSFMGIANANIAKMVIDDINAAGGLLGRRLELHLEDGATDDSEAEAKAAKLVQQD